MIMIMSDAFERWWESSQWFSDGGKNAAREAWNARGEHAEAELAEANAERDKAIADLRFEHTHPQGLNSLCDYSNDKLARVEALIEKWDTTHDPAVQSCRTQLKQALKGL